MLWTIFVILLVLWLLGVVTSYTLGGFIHILLIVAIAVALVGAPVAQPKEVVVGVLYPMSGNAAQVGIDCVNAVKLAADIVNANHGVYGVPNPVELFINQLRQPDANTAPLLMPQ